MSLFERIHFRGRGSLFAWFAAVTSGFAWLINDDTRPGPATIAPQIVAPAAVPRSVVQLVMFAHARCPCTRASLDELADIMRGRRSKVAATVLMWMPAQAGPEWKQSDLWLQAKEIPNVQVQADVEGKLARRLGVQTSGSVLLYDAKGQLLFSGGITGARGHIGQNRGAATVAAILDRKPGILLTPAKSEGAPVFGCALQQSASSPSLK